MQYHMHMLASYAAHYTRANVRRKHVSQRFVVAPHMQALDAPTANATVQAMGEKVLPS